MILSAKAYLREGEVILGGSEGKDVRNHFEETEYLSSCEVTPA